MQASADRHEQAWFLVSLTISTVDPEYYSQSDNLQIAGTDSQRCVPVFRVWS
jgi:hypothetical protein